GSLVAVGCSSRSSGPGSIWYLCRICVTTLLFVLQNAPRLPTFIETDRETLAPSRRHAPLDLRSQPLEQGQRGIHLALADRDALDVQPHGQALLAGERQQLGERALTQGD